jgi:hypothetical protein
MRAAWLALLPFCLAISAPVTSVAQPANAPAWENSEFTKFRSIDCPAGAPDMVIHRGSADSVSGQAEILAQGGISNGGWSLSGSQLQVSGPGISISGVWGGNRLSAHAVAPGMDVNCSYRVSGTSG